MNASVSLALQSINWSFSKLSMYESCPYRFKLKYIERCPEPPLPPDNPLERGNRIHNRLEKFIKGEGPMDTEARAIGKFHKLLEHLQLLYTVGMATAEDDWWFDKDWEPCQRSDVRLWVKLDYNVLDEKEAHAIVGDWKSGKSTYKAVDHIQQTQLYAAATAIKFEWADKITAELPYVDEGWVRSSTYTREEALRFVGRFEQRAQRIYNDKFFRPNPNVQTCRYCPFNRKGTGACAVAAL